MRRVLQLGDRYEMKHIRYESMDVEQIFHGDVLFQIHVVFRNIRFCVMRNMKAYRFCFNEVLLMFYCSEFNIRASSCV